MSKKIDQKRPEPETINISDDDEEAPAVVHPALSNQFDLSQKAEKQALPAQPTPEIEKSELKPEELDRKSTAVVAEMQPMDLAKSQKTRENTEAASAVEVDSKLVSTFLLLKTFLASL